MSIREEIAEIIAKHYVLGEVDYQVVADKILAKLREAIPTEMEKPIHDPFDMHAERYNGIIEGYNNYRQALLKILEE